MWDPMRYRDTINERAVRILLECILVSESGVERSWLCGEKITIADILLTVTLFRLRCVGFSRATFEDGQLPLVDQYFEFAKSNMPGYSTVCVNFKLETQAESAKNKKGCCIL